MDIGREWRIVVVSSSKIGIKTDLLIHFSRKEDSVESLAED